MQRRVRACFDEDIEAIVEARVEAVLQAKLDDLEHDAMQRAHQTLTEREADFVKEERKEMRSWIEKLRGMQRGMQEFKATVQKLTEQEAKRDADEVTQRQQLHVMTQNLERFLYRTVGTVEALDQSMERSETHDHYVLSGRNRIGIDFEPLHPEELNGVRFLIEQLPEEAYEGLYELIRADPRHERVVAHQKKAAGIPDHEPLTEFEMDFEKYTHATQRRMYAYMRDAIVGESAPPVKRKRRRGPRGLSGPWDPDDPEAKAARIRTGTATTVDRANVIEAYNNNEEEDV